MTIYKAIVCEEGGNRVVLLLEQLGALTRPWFMIQLRMENKYGVSLREPVTFYLEQQADATLPIGECVKIYDALIKTQCGIEDTWKRAIITNKTS